MLDRREFLKEVARLGVSASLAPLVLELLGGVAEAAPGGGLRPARYWHREGGAARCDLCPNRALLQPGDLGCCRVRENAGGRLLTRGYDRPCILNVDPIEKNPLAHVLPGAKMLSVAHAGCNLRCLYCQNWQFSQRSPIETKNVGAFDQGGALKKARENKLRGVVFTYTEPGVAAEFTGDMAALAKTKGLLPALCTCGYLLAKPFRDLLKPFAAVTVTLKGATERFYQDVCGASLKPVLDSMVLVRSEGKWLEVATLVVPTLNDDDVSLETMARWLVANVGAATPWHLERFQPEHKLLNLPPTPQATLERARRIGLEAGLKHVYISNFAPHEGNHTACPGCRKVVITRLGFKILKNELAAGGRCPHCREKIEGLWS